MLFLLFIQVVWYFLCATFNLPFSQITSRCEQILVWIYLILLTPMPVKENIFMPQKVLHYKQRITLSIQRPVPHLMFVETVKQVTNRQLWDQLFFYPFRFDLACYCFVRKNRRKVCQKLCVLKKSTYQNAPLMWDFNQKIMYIRYICLKLTFYSYYDSICGCYFMIYSAKLTDIFWSSTARVGLVLLAECTSEINFCS